MTKILSHKRALEIIDRFSQAKVLVVGDLMVDHFIWGKVSRISPEAPVPVVEVDADHLLLGGSANVLHNIYAMVGQKSGFLEGCPGRHTECKYPDGRISRPGDIENFPRLGRK